MLFMETPHTNPAINLAIEEYLFTNLPPDHPGYFLLWQNAPTVVVGRFQNAKQEVKESFLEEHGIGLIRRLSGGGAVYHDAGTLNYTFIQNSSGLAPEFRQMGRPIATVLQDLGFAVEFSGRNDLLLQGKKVAGLAYYRQSQKFLHHGSILVNTDLDMLDKVLQVDPDKYLSKGIASVRSRVMNLNEVAPLQVVALKTAIKQQLDAQVHNLSMDDWMGIQSLAQTKYASWDWIYGNSPVFTESKKQRFPWGMLELQVEVRQGHIIAWQLHGDFMSHDGIDLLHQAMLGIKYKDETVQAVLEQFNLPEIFVGCLPQDIYGFFKP